MRSSQVLRIAFLSFGLMLAPRLSAQSSLAGAALLGSWEADASPPGGSQNPSVPSQGIHGSAAGWWATAGVFATPRAGAAVELSAPSRFMADQVAAKYRTRNTHRDLIASGVLHVRPGPRWIEGVVGMSYVREETDQQVALRNFTSPGFEYEPFTGAPQAITRNTFGVVGGVDVPIALGGRLMVVPQLRVHWIAREDDASAESPRFLGLNPVVWRPACGVRFAF